MHFHARSLFGASGIVKRWGLLVVSGHERAPKASRPADARPGTVRATCLVTRLIWNCPLK
jgi:hypothetical protein